MLIENASLRAAMYFLLQLVNKMFYGSCLLHAVGTTDLFFSSVHIYHLHTYCNCFSNNLISDAPKPFHFQRT